MTPANLQHPPAWNSQLVVLFPPVPVLAVVWRRLVVVGCSSLFVNEGGSGSCA